MKNSMNSIGLILSILGGLVVASGTVWAEKVSVDFNAKLNCQVPTLVDTTTKSRKISEEIDIEIKKIDFNKGKSGMPPAWGSMSNIFKFVNGVKYEGALISNRKDSVAFEFIEGASDSETYLAIYELRLPTLTGRRTVMKIFSNSNSLQVSEINCSRR